MAFLDKIRAKFSNPVAGPVTGPVKAQPITANPAGVNPNSGFFNSPRFSGPVKVQPGGPITRKVFNPIGGPIVGGPIVGGPIKFPGSILHGLLNSTKSTGTAAPVSPIAHPIFGGVNRVIPTRFQSAPKKVVATKHPPLALQHLAGGLGGG